MRCAWKIKAEHRRCELCSYEGPCDRDWNREHPYVRKMASVVGEDIRGGSRRKEVVWGRYFVMYALRQEGYSTLRIAVALRRDHSSVVHGLGMVSKALSVPGMYADVLPIWEKFLTLNNNEL